MEVDATMTKKKPQVERECAICGQIFLPPIASTACCSDECKAERKRQQGREKCARYRERHPERVRERAARDRAKNRERNRKRSLEDYYANKEKYLALQREWRRQNPEAARERSRRSKERNPETAIRYRRENAERLAATHAAWRARNRELWNSYSRIRRAKLADAKIPQDVLDARIDYWGRKCWICGGEYVALDHVKPIRAGGPHIPANIRPICKSCNSRKSSRWPLEGWINDIREWRVSRPIGMEDLE